MKIGVLDIQGSVEEHLKALGRLALKRLGAQSASGRSGRSGQKIEPVLVKKAADFKDLDGLIIPGGESTTISKLIRLYGLDREIVALARRGGKILGTCAGAILLASAIMDGANGDGAGGVKALGLIDIDVDRNAYGRQLDSFETEIEVVPGCKGAGGKHAGGGKRVKIPAVFIRAPKISRVGKGCEVLAECKGEPVLVRGGEKGNILVATFHPEMGEDTSVYETFFGA